MLCFIVYSHNNRQRQKSNKIKGRGGQVRWAQGKEGQLQMQLNLRTSFVPTKLHGICQMHEIIIVEHSMIIKV